MNFHLHCCIVLNSRPTGKVDTGFFLSIWDHWSYPGISVLSDYFTSRWNFSFRQLKIWTAGRVQPYLTANGKCIFYPPRAGRWQGCRASLSICAWEGGTCHFLCLLKRHSYYQLSSTFKSVPRAVRCGAASAKGSLHHIRAMVGC